MAGPQTLRTDDNLRYCGASGEPALDTPGRLELRGHPLAFFLVEQRIIVVPLPVEIRTIEG
jgi:hypothetical protein